jgi:cell division protein FtsL
MTGKPRVSPRRRPSPVYKRSRVIPAILAVAIVVVGFATLMMRLELIQEGYRLSAVHADIVRLQDRNRELSLQAAQLSSHARLRALAPKYHLQPPRDGQVVMIP